MSSDGSGRRVVPPQADVVLALVLAGFAVAATLAMIHWQTVRGHPQWARPLDAVGFVLLIGGALPLPWRRRFPEAVFVCSALLVGAYYATGYPGGPSALFPAVALFTVALLRGPTRGAVVGVAMWLVALGAALLRGGVMLGAPVAGTLLWVLTAVAIGTAVRNRRSAMQALRQRVEAEARGRAEEERLRIAREVHDVVAHSLAVINVQAGVAAHVADRRPEQAREALLAIKEASRTALADLRATLGVLRSGATDTLRTSGDENTVSQNTVSPITASPADRAPAPGLHRLPELLESVRAAGLRVEVTGAPGELPAPVDVAGYRILQESLTNVVRHAPDATTVTVRFDRAGEWLRLVVRDDGRSSAVDGAAVHLLAGAGNGLRGMRERAEALGGWLSAAPAGGGGFEVQAVLPVHGGGQ